MSLVDIIHRQREFSSKTFGAGMKTGNILDHIRKEILEIEAKPGDLFEWVDVILLALDGAWRSGFGPTEIENAIGEKQMINESRKWPDWRTAEPDKAVEHIKEMAE